MRIPNEDVDPDDIGPSANLRGKDLGRADLAGANLREANLAGADLGDADLTDANLRNAVFHGASLLRSDLTDANLSYRSWTRSRDCVLPVFRRPTRNEHLNGQRAFSLNWL
ncbi:hypothetical protein DJ82_13725 [Halorubrum sp. Ib24]|uniref:pentapeptide repeat-containing protein n=1 Tax=Halorubrum sp. Ib24 TaxID=1383850 RepID=UPI000B9898F5|nr:hypothetical protein DJ82_13725 [Halorubrum sp. Ib24]